MIDDLTLRYVLRVPTRKADGEEMPLVICMHGRGADANDLASLADEIDEGYRWVFPNAPRPFEIGGGMTFGWTWFDGLPPDRESIAGSRALLLRFVEEIKSRYRSNRIVMSGFSQGGVMALDVGFRMTPRPAGIAVMSGALHEIDLPDLTEQATQRVLMLHGTYDDMIPVNAARRARRVLQEHGIEPEYHEFPMGHHVTPDSLAVVKRFLQSVLR